MARCLPVLVLLTLFASNVSNADTDSRAAALRAAFLYNFAKFTRWPENRFTNNDMPVTFCMLGGALDGAAARVLDGKKISGRSLAFRDITGTDGLPGCNLLYGNEATVVKWDDLITRATELGVLLVTDSPALADMGGHISLFPIDGKMRFKINIRSVHSSGINLSSKLLNLAIIVE